MSKRRTAKKGPNESTFYTPGIPDGERVVCMFLERQHPRKYLQVLEKENAKRKEEADKAMGEFVPLEPSWKEGGVSWKCLVVQRQGEEEGVNLKTCKVYDDGTVELPENLKVEFNITILPPDEMKYLGKVGSEKKAKDGNPYTIEPWPSAYPAKDFDTGVTADKIPEGQEGQYADLIAQDEERRLKRKVISNEYENMSEDEALAYLESMIAKKYLLCKYDEDEKEFIYFLPEKGMTFRAISVERKNFQTFEAFIWNREERRYEFYNSEQPDETSPHLVEFANEALKAIDKRWKQRKEENDPKF